MSRFTREPTCAERRIRAVLLAEGGPARSNVDIGAELEVSARVVRRVRGQLGIPAYARGRRNTYASVADAVAARTREEPGGHLAWDGPCHEEYRTPLVNHAGMTRSVARVVFVQHYGREPVGYVKATCERAHCVAGAHLADSLMRKG